MGRKQPDDKSRGAEPEEQVTIWTVRRKLFVSYFILFSLLFILVTAVATWLEYNQISNAKELAELIMAAMGVASGRVLWLAACSIIAVEVGNMIVEYLIVDRYKRGKKDGQQSERASWQAWYERQQAAQREGRPFNEPPPAGPEDGKGK